VSAPQRIEVELPAEALEDFGSTEAASERLRQFAVLDLLRRRRISQGRAVELLGVSRPDLWDLMAEWGISVADPTDDELDQDASTALAAAHRPPTPPPA
jgi:predicted HTH domain antitoxin